MKKFAIGLCSFVLILFLQESCTKIDTTTLGTDLIPSVDNVNTFDITLEVISSSYFLEDSTRIGSTSNHALGTLEDPAFGKTHADFYFDVSPAVSGANPFINKDSAQIIDSVVLSLNYKGLYGDSTSLQNIKVFEMAQSANFTDSISGYLINTPDFPVEPTALGQKLVDFTTLNDSLQVILKHDTARLISELHIKLDNNFGRRLADYDTTNAYKSDSAFHTYFKGLAIKADEASSPLRRALAYFDISDITKTKLRVYYRTPGKDTLAAEFTFVGFSNANLVKRTINGTEYANNIANSSKNKDKLYLQSSPGSKAIITIPGLNGLSNRVIHKAELIMPILPSTENSVFTVPNYIFLDQVDSANNRYVTVKNDFVLSSANSVGYNYQSFGGVPNNNQYIFDISRRVQQIATEKTAVFSFRLYAPYTTYPYYYLPNTPGNIPLSMSRSLVVDYPISFGRVVLAGGSSANPPNMRMRLRIIYSRI